MVRKGKYQSKGHIEQRNKCAQKTVEQYAWLKLVQSANIKKLLVFELEKYLKHYKLSSNGTKADKIYKNLFACTSVVQIRVVANTLMTNLSTKLQKCWKI